eukprot:gnl/TRDRNA2_/TRDRNA2_51729_c0_seq1.p1 gnl/TRDRNA2_/TRDRNA2_51729_c0~~gnl/TRDRNA2_/TRDRNA2_51729_c0_seq1.p1  ORF type:complete len:122 (+),score=27.65 gnl/TRDRNA2_/TRDRNA2_51729_c0_seq1:54-419(+)
MTAIKSRLDLYHLPHELIEFRDEEQGKGIVVMERGTKEPKFEVFHEREPPTTFGHLDRAAFPMEKKDLDKMVLSQETSSKSQKSVSQVLEAAARSGADGRPMDPVHQARVEAVLSVMKSFR